MEKVAGNEKSCSKCEKLPKSCRATCGRPEELNGAKEIEITRGTCVKKDASKPSLYYSMCKVSSAYVLKYSETNIKSYI